MCCLSQIPDVLLTVSITHPSPKSHQFPDSESPHFGAQHFTRESAHVPCHWKAWEFWLGQAFETQLHRCRRLKVEEPQHWPQHRPCRLRRWGAFLRDSHEALNFLQLPLWMDILLQQRKVGASHCCCVYPLNLLQSLMTLVVPTPLSSTYRSCSHAIFLKNLLVLSSWGLKSTPTREFLISLPIEHSRMALMHGQPPIIQHILSLQLETKGFCNYCRYISTISFILQLPKLRG